MAVDIPLFTRRNLVQGGMGGGDAWWGGAPLQLGVFGGLPQKNLEISGSEKCILVDPGDGFAMDT